MTACFGAGAQDCPHTRLAGGDLISYPRPLLMGIINVTPDSFYAGSRRSTPEAALEAAREMLAAGADILDLGAESTRPGACRAEAAEEARRLASAIMAVRSEFPRALLSADTSKASVAEAALAAGADILNDVGALTFDPDMAHVAARAGAPVVLMHNRGFSADMQSRAVYADAAAETLAFLKERAAAAEAAGIARDRIILDPGIGFGKKLEHNLDILRRLDSFFGPDYPLLVGASRKTFIGQLLGTQESPAPPEARLEGTLASTVYLAAKGTHIIRVHDVKESAAALKVTAALWR